MTTLDLIAAFNLPPDQAIAFLRSKGLVIDFDWQEAGAEAKIKSFWVSGLKKLDALQSIKNAVDKAVAEGETFADFKQRLIRTIEDQDAEDIKAPLKTIFSTNIQTAYMAGSYKTLVRTAKYLPYWKFTAMRDRRSSKICPRLHNIIARWDDPFWDTHFPPLHFNCRSNIIPLTEAQAKAQGITPPEILKAIAQSIRPAKSFDYNPGKTTFKPDLNKYDPKLRTYLNPSP